MSRVRIPSSAPKWYHRQAVRQRSAKPLFPGSNPGGTSISFLINDYKCFIKFNKNIYDLEKGQPLHIKNLWSGITNKGFVFRYSILQYISAKVL